MMHDDTYCMTLNHRIIRLHYYQYWVADCPLTITGADGGPLCCGYLLRWNVTGGLSPFLHYPGSKMKTLTILRIKRFPYHIQKQNMSFGPINDTVYILYSNIFFIFSFFF